MKAPMIGVLVVMTVAVVGIAPAAEAPADESRKSASPPEAFIPGPPLWLPPEMHPKTAIAVDDLEQAVDQCVGDAMTAADTPGASVAVIVDGVLVYQQGYGVKRRGGSDPVDAETQFRVGSVTKMFTGAATMQQVEAGTVFLDDRLSRFVPEVEFLGHWPAEAMTIEHLLTHSTGIPDLPFTPNDETGPNALSDWADSLDRVGLHAPPGAFWNYSNPNFNFAGLVVERASGMEYRSYMDTYVFGPAGMENTTFEPAAVTARGNASHGHMPTASGGEIIYAPDGYDNGAYAPAGYAFSTAGDLVKWALLLSDGGGAVLSPESAKWMQLSHRSLETFPGYGYGYGIFVEPFFNLEVRQHGGNIWGWGTYLLWHPQQQFAVAVLANTFQSLPGAAYCIADVVLEPDHSGGPEIPPADQDRWRLFEGIYDGSVVAGLPVNPYPVMGEVFSDSQGELTAHFWDPNGGWSSVWNLDHIGFDVFYVDIDWDGVYDLDLTFLTSRGTHERTRWMRMRQVVGSPQLVPRHGSQSVP